MNLFSEVNIIINFITTTTTARLSYVLYYIS